jgi:hypothetical protein
MRLAVACKRETANAHYRAIQPLRELERRGHRVCWPSHPSFAALGNGSAPDWDLLHVHQFIDEGNLELIERLRAHGVAVVWDTDDDISQVPRSSPEYRRLGGRRKIKRHFERTIAIAQAAHLMTTTCEHLAELYRSAGVEHVAVIENYLAPEDVARPRRRHPGVVIGCTAAGEHISDLEQLRIGEVLGAMLRAHEGVRVVTIGEELKIRDPRYTHHPFVGIERLIDLESEFDVGIAPLVDSMMNRSRSNVKLKEYAAAGATWLASPIGPYVGMGEEQGGQLVQDEGWFDALNALVLDARRRAELAGRARAWVKRESVRTAGGTWEAAFRGAVLRARGEAQTVGGAGRAG